MNEHDDEYSSPPSPLWRRRRLARLAAARSDLLHSLLSLDEETLCERPLPGGYTVKQLLAHIGAWDELHAGRLALLGEGRAQDLEPVDVDSYNEEWRQVHQDWSLEQAVTFFRLARQSYLESLAGISDELLHQEWELPWGDKFRLSQALVWRDEHDAGHRQEIRAWRQQGGVKSAGGDRHVLDAFVEAANAEICALLTLADNIERESRPICGQWTWLELIGHLADWNWYGLEGLGVEASSRSLPLPFDGPETIADWNERHATVRQAHTWKRVWQDYITAYATFRELMAGLEQTDLARPMNSPAPWDWQGMRYQWIVSWPDHEREHAVNLRSSG
jgi:hypothetical protein